MNSDAPLATDFGYPSQGDPEDNSDTILPSDREFTSSIDLLPPLGLSPYGKLHLQLNFGPTESTITVRIRRLP